MKAAIKDYLASLSSTQKSQMMDLRRVILQADKELTESIKWGSICFSKGKNICGFKVAKKHITLVFFEGAKINDKYHLLTGEGKQVRNLKYDGTHPLNIAGIEDLMIQAIKISNTES